MQRFKPRLALWVERVGETTSNNSGAHAAPSRGRRVLSIANNPQAVPGHSLR